MRSQDRPMTVRGEGLVAMALDPTSGATDAMPTKALLIPADSLSPDCTCDQSSPDAPCSESCVDATCVAAVMHARNGG